MLVLDVHIVLCYVLFFFFKQKTAYEMRISDWSSDVCSSDLAGYAGLEDSVDWHWDRVFAGAALTTLLGIGAELAAPENRQDGNRVVIAGRDGLQDSVNQVGQEMTRRNMNKIGRAHV